MNLSRIIYKKWAVFLVLFDFILFDLELGLVVVCNEWRVEVRLY